MKLSLIGSIVCALFILGCSSTSKVPNAEALQALDELMAKKAFVFKARFANPLATRSMNAIANSGLIQPGSTVNNIDLTSIDNYLTIKGDSVFADLPYYGERQMAAPYNSTEIGILFEGIPKGMLLEYNEKRKVYELQFSINNKTEILDVHATIFPNKNASININSSQRLTISYHGAISAMEEEE